MIACLITFIDRGGHGQSNRHVPMQWRAEGGGDDAVAPDIHRSSNLDEGHPIKKLVLEDSYIDLGCVQIKELHSGITKHPLAIIFMFVSDSYLHSGITKHPLAIMLMFVSDRYLQTLYIRIKCYLQALHIRIKCYLQT